MAKVAFIGLGNMGGPMAINLVKAGHAVTAFDLSAAALAQVKAEGAAVAATAAEAVTGAEFVISMLPAGKHVLGLYLGEQGIAGNISKDALVIDCSTIDADSARKVGAGLGKTTGWIHRSSLKKKGVEMIAGVNYLKVDDDGLWVEIAGEERCLNVDNVIICAGQEPQRELLSALAEKGINAHLIGGADVAAELDAKRAIRQGAELAARL